MKTNKFIIIIPLLIIVVLKIGRAQTMPEPFSLEPHNYELREFSSETKAGDYPISMIFHQIKVKDPALKTKMTSDWVLSYNLTSKSRIVALDTLGILFQNTSQQNLPDGAFLGEAVLALDTYNCCDVKVQWTGRTISAAERDYALTLQYKIGDIGDYKDLGSTYYSSETSGDFIKMPQVSLPDEVKNLPIIYLRWKYHYLGSEEGERSGLAIDDIIVSATIYCAVKEKETHNIKISPNPTNGKFIINYFADKAEEIDIKIYSMNGKLIYTQNIFVTLGENIFPIRMNNNNFSNGEYILKISNNDDLNISEKVIIIKS